MEALSGAFFSDDRKHRYALWRIWDAAKPFIMFIGLNPSTANETETDPTITRVINFAKNWGYGGVYMMNLFSYVSTDPANLVTCTDNSINDTVLYNTRIVCKEVIFAWGNFKVAQERAARVAAMFPGSKALVLNKNGSPRHPLYVKGDVKPVEF